MNPTPEMIIETRKKAGLTMQALADMMQVSRMTIHNWNTGTHPMKPRDWEYLQMKLKAISDE